MENSFKLIQIGLIHAGDDGFSVALDPAYRPALLGLEGFSHVQLLWWFSGCDTPGDRAALCERRPYVKGPGLLGTFATRSPRRPNPVALSCAALTGIDAARGVLRLAWLDADDGSPVLDLKPYTPSLDRVERPGVPDWCAHWPDSVEAGGEFPWEEEFRF